MYHGTFHDYVVLTSQQTIMNFSIVIIYIVIFLDTVSGDPCKNDIQIPIPYKVFKKLEKLFTDIF